MKAIRAIDALDARVVFWSYALLAGVAGVLIIGWGPMLWGMDLPGLPYGKAALIRIGGASMVAAACFAVAVANVDDPVARRNGLAWFAAGHFIIFLIANFQRTSVLDAWMPEWLMWIPFAAAILLSSGWQQVGRDERGNRGILLTLFGLPSARSTEQLRSAYEQRIREAAGQEERHRLARDLHDAIKQQIFVVQTSAATVEARFDSDPAGARGALEQVRVAAREAMAEMQAMLDQLRAAPLEVNGLVEALRKQCEALGFRTGARVDLKIGDLPRNEALAPGAPEAIFRAAQEALANVGRHARAANVVVSLDVFRRRFELTVRDDGKGFDISRTTGGMGIRNLRERANEFGGGFELLSTPGEGTYTCFHVPVETVAPEKDWRKEIWMWSACLAVFLVIGVLGRTPSLLISAPISLLGLTRAVSGYLSTRSLRGSAR